MQLFVYCQQVLSLVGEDGRRWRNVLILLIFTGDKDIYTKLVRLLIQNARM